MAFLLVLLGHSFPDSAYEFINSGTRIAHEYIYSFHMPLFFVISGICMMHVLKDPERDIKVDIKKRIIRLLIPYLFWSYVAIIPKVVFSKFMYLPYDSSQTWKILLGSSPNGTMWYIWTLFFINVIFILLSRVTQNEYVWAGVAVAGFVVQKIFGIPYAGLILHNCLYYVIGVFIAIWKTKIDENVTGNKVVPVIALGLMLVNVPVSIILDTQANLVSSVLCGTALVMLVIYVKDGITKNCLGRFILLASAYSYGIYILSPWVQVAIRIFLYKKLGLNYVICFAAMFVLGFLIPYCVLKVSEKLNWRWLNVLLQGKA